MILILVCVAVFVAVVALLLSLAAYLYCVGVQRRLQERVVAAASVGDALLAWRDDRQRFEAEYRARWPEEAPLDAKEPRSVEFVADDMIIFAPVVRAYEAAWSAVVEAFNAAMIARASDADIVALLDGLLDEHGANIDRAKGECEEHDTRAVARDSSTRAKGDQS